MDSDADGGLTVAEAAARLGVSKDALYKRIRRGTIRFVRRPDGEVRVWLPSATPSTPAASGIDALLAEKDARIASLERQLDVRAEEARRWSILLAQMNDRLKALDTSLDTSGDVSKPDTSPRVSWWEKLLWGSQGKPKKNRE